MIDRFGRRVLMYIGSVGYIVSLALTGMAFYNESYALVPVSVFRIYCLPRHRTGCGDLGFYL
jgi:hypothetical protein